MNVVMPRAQGWRPNPRWPATQTSEDAVRCRERIRRLLRGSVGRGGLANALSVTAAPVLFL